MKPGVRPVRFAVVGLGAFGEAYLRCLQGMRAAAGVEIAAVCSRAEERARSLAVALALVRSAEDDREVVVAEQGEWRK
ncbi:MAG: hypothetical protein HY332_23530 [Chloroflexi bacterium]|nr:hypothetical protein [Chloroflexota bacterium]